MLYCFANLILKYSDKVQSKDIEKDVLTKLYSMSLKVNWPLLEF
jgi:glutaminyl-tRNA synthetase